MEVFDAHQSLGYLIKLFYTPARVIDVAELLNAVGVSVQERSSQSVCGTGDGVLDQTQGYRLALAVRVQGRLRRHYGDHFIGARSANKGIGHTAGLGLDAQYRVNVALCMGMEHRVGEITAVINDDVALAQRCKVCACHLAFIAMGYEVEIDGDFRLQLIQTTQQALGVVCVVRRGSVTVLNQRAWQIDSRPIDGENPVSVPTDTQRRCGCTGAGFAHGVV